MYTKESKEHQFKFTDDWFMVPELDESHVLFKIARSIDWVRLSAELSGFYCPDNGRPAKPSRAKVGLLIIKHLYQISDRDVVDLLKRDVYVQYLCDISFRRAQTFINPSSLSKFRGQISTEGIKIIEEEICRVINKVKPPKGRRLVTDTTIVPANIAYPTDVSLLEKVRRKAVGFLDRAKELGTKHYRTYKRVAKKIFIEHQKIRKHTIKTRKRAQKKVLQFASRNIRQLKEALHDLREHRTAREPVGDETSIGEESDGTMPMAADCQQWQEEAKEFLQVADQILDQQKDLYHCQEVKDRIVSVHQPHIRPMVRGKYPVNVEFGPKVLLNLYDDYLWLEDIQFNNVSDTQLLDCAIDGYQTRRGHIPSQLAADRGFWSKDNAKKARERGIMKVAIENKGKSNYLKGKPFAKRLRRLRCKIEAKISLGKRNFGLNRCRYYMKHGEEIWIRLGLSAMNLKMAMGYS